MLVIDEAQQAGSTSKQKKTDRGQTTGEQEVCREMAYNIIQSIFVAGILKKVDDISKRHCYGCQLPMVDDVTQTNHNCLMDSQSEKVEQYFVLAVDEIVDTQMGKYRREWNIKAQNNSHIVAQFPTIQARNDLFTAYVDMHVKQSESDVLYNICLSE